MSSINFIHQGVWSVSAKLKIWVPEQHVSHLRPASDAELNRLLGMVVDVENIYMSMQKEEDPDTKRVYIYLFKLLRKCIVTMTKPAIEGPLGQPPFESPSIAQAVSNFLLYKFGNSSLRVTVEFTRIPPQTNRKLLFTHPKVSLALLERSLLEVRI